jgi:thiol:disulfide interchange protein
MTKDHMTAREFLREFTQSQSRVQLGTVAAVAALSVLAAVACMTAGLPGWLAVASAAGTLAFEAGVLWWLLGIERVQRWIRDGR